MSAEDSFEKLFVCLERENKFPSWFKGSKSYLSIPLNKRIGKTSRFNYNHEYFGENDDFKFYMIQIGVSEFPSDDYIISIVFNAKPKPKKSVLGTRKLMFSYHILPPIYV